MTGKKTEEENEIMAKYDYEQFLDMEEYKKEHPDDPYCNYHVRGWKDGYNDRINALIRTSCGSGW